MLRESEVALADFFERAAIGLHWVGPDGTILRANSAELALLGYDHDEYVGRHIAEFYVDPQVADDILGRLAKGESLRQYPARLRCKSGQIKDVLIDSSVYLHNGRLVHSRCFTRDVTGEQQVQETAARLAAIVSSSSDAIVGKTLDGIITSWNAAAERIFGYTAAEMVGQTIFRLIPEELHDAERELLARLRRGEMVELADVERIRKDGQRIWISLSVSPIRDRSGAILGAASIKRDITERKRVEEQLRHTQRLQAVGQLAGGLAHEANNQMTVILGAAQFLLCRNDLLAAVREDVEHIRQAAERTASITRQLLAFSRRQMLRPQDLDLDAVIQAMEPVLRRSLSETQELVIQSRLSGQLVRADPTQVEQVLLNLTLNARDAMPEGGRLIIETCDIDVVDGDAGGYDGIPAGTYAIIAVTDTGRGMDAETLQRVFEPFFTTKDVGEGTGLGLAVVHGIITQTGGSIRVESSPGQGATFTLYFPVVAARVAPDGAPAIRPALAGHGKSILVVEDDPDVRTMIVRSLVEAGYTTLEAEHGRAALERIRTSPGGLDLVISDIGMPELGGRELAARITAEWPDVPVLLISGYGDVVAGYDFLQKPFHPDALVQKVGELLAAPATADADPD